MKELKEIEFGSVTNINLENHKVKSAILPQTLLNLTEKYVSVATLLLKALFTGIK